MSNKQVIMGKKQKQFVRAVNGGDWVCRSDFLQWKSDVNEMMRLYLKEYKAREDYVLIEKMSRKIDELVASVKGTLSNQNMIKGRPFIRESEAMQRYKLSKRTFCRFRTREGLDSFLIGSESCYFIDSLEEFIFDRSIDSLTKTLNTNNYVKTKRQTSATQTKPSTSKAQN